MVRKAIDKEKASIIAWNTISRKMDIQITRDTAQECEEELWGQITDGVFENSRTGKVEEI